MNPNKNITPNKNKRHLKIIFFTVLMDMIGVGILIPIIPYLFDINSQYNIISGSSFINSSNSLFWQGFTLAVYPLFQFLFAPILGELSDHYGRKRILILCLIGTLIGNLLTAVAILNHNFELFIIGRIIDGITAGNISIAMASIADVSEDKDKAKNFGMIGAAFGIGFIVGPAIGGILSKHFGVHTPFLFSSTLGLINIILVTYFLRETLAKKISSISEKTFKLHPYTAIKNIVIGFKMPQLRIIFTANLLWVSAFAFYTSFIGVYLKNRFGFELDQVGYYFAYIGICIAINQGILVRYVFQKFEDVKILKSCLIVFSFIISIFIFSHSLLVNLLLIPIFTVCIGLSNAAISAMTSKRAGPEIQGRIIGISSSLQALGGTLPQFTAGLLAVSFGYTAPLYGAIILALLAAYVITKDKFKFSL